MDLISIAVTLAQSEARKSANFKSVEVDVYDVTESGVDLGINSSSAQLWKEE